jgi:hypothetical protein
MTKVVPEPLSSDASEPTRYARQERWDDDHDIKKDSARDDNSDATTMGASFETIADRRYKTMGTA